jgi:hypothetical protein
VHCISITIEEIEERFATQYD